MGIFKRVVERGSFVGAAEDVGLSPSAVSKLVARLERRLGVRLINRTTRQLALTAEGEVSNAQAKFSMQSRQQNPKLLPGACPRRGTYECMRFHPLPLTSLLPHCQIS